MKIDDRKRLIFDFLFSQSGLLRRYAAPDMLSADRQREEINDMVTDMNAEIPGHYTPADFERLFDELRVQVRRRHGARTWPTIKVLLASLADAIGKIEANKAPDDVENFMLDRMTIWYRQFGDEMPSCGSEERTAALIERGVLTAAEARKAGFAMSKKLRDEAMDEQRRIEIPDMRL